MNISIEQLLDLITYHGMIDGISIAEYPWLVNTLDKYHEAESHTMYHIEWYTENHPILWTYSGWINEYRRRKSLEEVCAKVPEVMRRLTKSPTEDKLRQAILKGDMKEFLKLKLLGE